MITWSSKVGEILHGRKELVEFCGMYKAPGKSGGSKATFKWKCLRCLKVQGPTQYGDIKRYPVSGCCSKSDKYGRTRWGYRHISGEYMRSLHLSAMKRGYEFSVTSEYLYEVWKTQDGRCAYTDTPLKLLAKHASLDRIDPTQGYIPGNVQWVLTLVNRMKWDSTEEEFIRLSKVIAAKAERDGK